MKIYLIRHGESQANERNLFLGHGDLDLTKKRNRAGKKDGRVFKQVAR